MARKKPKTHKGIKKRMKRSSTGKIIHRGAGASHLMGSKNAKRKRKIRSKRQMKGNLKKSYGVLLPK